MLDRLLHAPSSPTSTASPTDYATTTPPPKPCAEPPPAPDNRYADNRSQVGNFDEHAWGFSTSVIKVGSGG